MLVLWTDTGHWVKPICTDIGHVKCWFSGYKVSIRTARSANRSGSIRMSKKKSKVLPEPQGPWGGADLRFLSPQPDTSLHCETTDTGPVYRMVCPFTLQLSLVLTAPTHGGMAGLS